MNDETKQSECWNEKDFPFPIQPAPRPKATEKCKKCGHEGFYHTHNDYTFSYPRDDSTWCGHLNCDCKKFDGIIIPIQKDFNLDDVEMELVLRIKHKNVEKPGEIILTKNKNEIMFMDMRLVLARYLKSIEKKVK